MPMYDYDIYEQDRGAWFFVATIRAPSRDEAAQVWIESRPAYPFRVMWGRIPATRYPV
jgi:hypothetical protein